MDLTGREILDMQTAALSFRRRGMHEQAADCWRRIGQAWEAKGCLRAAADAWWLMDRELAQCRPSAPANVAGLVD